MLNKLKNFVFPALALRPLLLDKFALLMSISKELRTEEDKLLYLQKVYEFKYVLSMIEKCVDKEEFSELSEIEKRLENEIIVGQGETNELL